MQSASKNRPLQGPKPCCLRFRDPKPRRQRYRKGEAEQLEMLVELEPEVLVQQEPQPEQQELLASPYVEEEVLLVEHY